MFFPSGKLHICKECALKIVDENGQDGLLGLLRFLNKPFYQALFKGNVPDYIRMVNSMHQYKNVGFTQSDSLVALTDITNIKKIKPTKLTVQEYQDAQDEDVELTEFSDEIDEWVIEAFKAIGLDTAKSVLEQDLDDLVKRTDLEEETIQDVINILKSEFED